MSRLIAARATAASRALPLLALALGASVFVHAWLLTGAVSEPPPGPRAWGRLEARLAPGPAPGAAPPAASDHAAVPEPAGVVPASRPRATPPRASGAADALRDEPLALPLISQGSALVLPTGVRAVYRDAAGREAELLWRLAGERYLLRWTAPDATAPQHLTAWGSMAWSGLLPLRAERRDRTMEAIDLDWGAGRSRGSREAPLRPGTLDAASLLMQLAVAHQSLPAAQRRSGWSVPVLGSGWARIAEIEPGYATGPRYRIDWTGGPAQGPWVEVELDPQLAFLPVRLTQSAAAGGQRWELAAVDELFVE